LIILTLIVATIAVACVGLLARRSTIITFHNYVTTNEASDLQRFRVVLLEHYRQHGSWIDAQPLLERLAVDTDKQLILVDAQRRMLATFPRELLQSNIRITPEHDLNWDREERRGRELAVSQIALRNVPNVSLNDSVGSNVGTLYIARIFPAAAGWKEDLFIGALNRALLLAALLSAGIALLAAVVLSHRIVRPVDILTKAARRMEKGDFGQRVDIVSKDEIGELGRAFNSMADSLVRSEQLRRNMVSDVAHELRTPLTNIRCQVETLQDGLVYASPEIIESLHQEAMLLNRLVDDLQDLALAEAGQLGLALKRVSIKDEVVLAMKAIQRQASEGNLVVKSDVGDNCPDVLADSVRLGQVFRNLLNNAINHTPPGGFITIEATHVDSWLELKIEDTGQGISPEDLPNVFERFYRADVSRDRATGGAGLGLAIVRQIISAHGGKTRIESTIGEGTKIYFTLPIFDSQRAESGPPL